MIEKMFGQSGPMGIMILTSCYKRFTYGMHSPVFSTTLAKHKHTASLLLVFRNNGSTYNRALPCIANQSKPQLRSPRASGIVETPIPVAL